MAKIEKIALVEFNGSHDECLMTQMLALKSANVYVIWITTDTMYERCTHLHELIDDVYILQLQHKAWNDFRKMLKLIRFLKRESVPKIIFNTAQSGNVRNLSFLLPRSIKAFGIIHTLRKFNGVNTQYFISKKIKKYFVLSDDLLNRIEIPKGLSISSFYPIDFPHYDSTIEKPENEYWISLTGGVETRRKDLISILDFINQTPENVKFIFLGKSDLNKSETDQFLTQIKELKYENRVKWFESFVSQEQFDAYLKQTDFLMPLIHPNTPSAEQYIKNQISGAFLLSFSYRIPLLIHQFYNTESDLIASSFFYQTTNFSETLNDAIENREKIKASIESNPKWQSKYQQRKYLDFFSIGQNK